MPNSQGLSGGAIFIERIPPNKVNYDCVLCDARTRIEYKLYAVYTFIPTGNVDENNPPEDLILCPLHEVELMEKMVNNYAKRLRRRRTDAPALPLFKEKGESKFTITQKEADDAVGNHTSSNDAD